MMRKAMNDTIEERFLDCAGRPFARAKGKKKLRPASLGMTVLARMTLLVLAVSSFLALNISAQVTAQRLMESGKEPQNWLMYSGDYAGRRYSALEQINA